MPVPDVKPQLKLSCGHVSENLEPEAFDEVCVHVIRRPRASLLKKPYDRLILLFGH
jgi:hypothetical protein